MVRGDVFFVDLAPRSGSEQRGRRPGVIVSTDAFNEAKGWRGITIVPLTTAVRWQVPSPTTVALDLREANLPKRCAAVAHQVTTIDKAKVVGSRIGQLSAAKLRELDQALRNYLEL